MKVTSVDTTQNGCSRSFRSVDETVTLSYSQRSVVFTYYICYFVFNAWEVKNLDFCDALKIVFANSFHLTKPPR